ncbi:MAG: hypothetical protein M3322_13360, partial [Actinomycetota bacterium]|nr:hypothetical protein [Actinomycetota bacterium]
MLAVVLGALSCSPVASTATWVKTGRDVWRHVHGSGELLAYGPPPTARSLAVFDEKAPVCSKDGYGLQMIIVVPRGSTVDQTVESARRLAAQMNALLDREARRASGGPGADYKFICAADGQPLVTTEAMPAIDGTSYRTGDLEAELKRRGYTDRKVKYIMLDESPANYCSGPVIGDDSDSPNNKNNGTWEYGPTFAEIGNGCQVDPGLATHEVWHTLGAVQPTAPHSSGYGHCWQGSDYLCYPDGGPKWPSTGMVIVCDEAQLDCMHDDYFDTKIGAGLGGGRGTYIDTHWNIGECYVHYIVNYACTGTEPPPPPPASPTPTPAPPRPRPPRGQVGFDAQALFSLRTRSNRDRVLDTANAHLALTRSTRNGCSIRAAVQKLSRQLGRAKYTRRAPTRSVRQILFKLREISAAIAGWVGEITPGMSSPCDVVAAHFKTARALVRGTLSSWKLSGQRVQKKRRAGTAPVVRLRVQQILHATTWQSVPVV